MQRIKKLTAIILSILTLSSVCVFGGAFSAGASGTGAGLAEWALNASSEELVVGGWVNSALHSLSLSEMDKITRGKIDILLSFQR